MMRLVRDDGHVITDTDVMVKERPVRKSRARSQDPSPSPTDEAPIVDAPSMPAPFEEPDGDAPLEASAESSIEASIDQPDGAIEDAADDSTDESSVAAQVDLRTLEALLFSTHHPLTAGRIAELLELESTKPVKRAVRELNEQYITTDRSFRVEQVAGGYQLLTLPDFGEILQKLHQRDVDTKLTKAALETLSIIAYKQPILRADIEAIRGVACGETIRSLMEKHLVRIDGRAEIPGRPILYGTTKRFLELFGLNSVKDLPQGETNLPSQPQ